MAHSPDKRAQTRRRGRGTKNNLRGWQLQQAGVGVGRGPGPLRNAGIGSPGWLLQPARLEKILSSVLDRREERAERRTAHIAALRKRAAETDAKLKRLYDAIENGIADLADPMLKDCIAELKATRDQARADAERAEGIVSV